MTIKITDYVEGYLGYISHFGSAFALCAYRVQVWDLEKRLAENKVAIARMTVSLCQHFEDNADTDDEALFGDISAAWFDAGYSDIERIIRTINDQILYVQFEGTEPGSQAVLDALYLERPGCPPLSIAQAEEEIALNVERTNLL